MTEEMNNITEGKSSSLSREERGGSGKKSPLTGRFRGSAWMTADPINYGLLKKNARANRKDMTEAESVFWSLVKSNALGQKCLRQHVIGDYIVDFLFRKSKVIVELDGRYHFTEEQQKEDTIRAKWLESQNYKVVRFTNEQVLFDTNKTIELLKVSLNREI